MFDYLSSPIRWCESINGNIYLYSNLIVEFWNSITSIIFCFFAIFGWIAHRNLKLDYVPWIYLFLIGVTSTWFHSTLSFMGQFCDELSIILLISYCLRVFYNINILLYYLITIFVILISWWYPSVSPPVLMVIGLTLISLTYFYISDSDSKYLWRHGMYIGLFSILTWIFDFVCLFNTHMYWHVFVSIAAYYMILLIIKPRHSVVLKKNLIPYWVRN
jgi:hypothetical protein